MGKPGQATFGATGFGGQQSPWGAISQPPSKIPVNTFSSNAAAPSGFASFATKTPSSSSPFGSFAAPSGDKPGFVGLEKQTSAFSANGSTALSTGPSFTSNASTVDFSSFGSGTGSNTSDAMTRERDEATPTPQLPAAQKTGFSGLPSSGFALGSIFKGDGTAKDDKTTAGSGGSLFGNGFNSVLTETTKPPATPEQAKNLPNFSNTPATQPKQPNLFSGSTPAKNKPEVIPEEAPLPPDPMTYKPAKIDDDLPPIAGSPPVQVEAPSSSIPSSPLEGDDEEGAVSDEEQEDTEGDSEDDASEDDAVEPSPSNAARRGRSSNRSPPIYPAAPTPPPQSSQQFKPMPMPHGQPFKASPLSFGQSVASANQSQTSLGGTRREPLPGSGQSLSASVQHSSRPPTPQPQVRDLVDDEDERIRQELASDREPTRVLDDFLARQEYNGAALSKTGHAAQIEIVYRDINNMVDTLGLNWRSLKSFIDYHEQPEGYTKLTQETLTQIQQLGENGLWYEHRSLAEIEDLKALENDLEQGLEEVRVQNLDDKRTQLSRLFREQGRLSTKLNEIRSTIIHRKDPEKLEAARKASLPKELADQQKALRNEYGRLLTLLGEAEGAVMLLKSKLASYNAENGKTGAVPTVDAIKKTINKLIMITEKKSNEIALLESQFRKVGLADSSRSNSSTSRQPGTPLRRSRAFRSETPAVTPPTNRSKMSLSELNRRALTPDVESTPNNGFGRYYTPEGTPSADKTLTKLGDLGDVDLARLRGKATRRRMIVGELEAAFGAVGAKQRGVFN
jgi:nucleoporin NUP159